MKDEELRNKIRELREKILNFGQIDESSDKVRKLYDHYLPMLKGIIEDYIRVEGHDESLVTTASSRKQLSDTLDLISSAFDSLSKDTEDLLDEDQSEVHNLNEVLKK